MFTNRCFRASMYTTQQLTFGQSNLRLILGLLSFERDQPQLCHFSWVWLRRLIVSVCWSKIHGWPISNRKSGFIPSCVVYGDNGIYLIIHTSDNGPVFWGLQAINTWFSAIFILITTHLHQNCDDLSVHGRILPIAMECYVMHQLLLLLRQWKYFLNISTGSSVIRGENGTTEWFLLTSVLHLCHDCESHEISKDVPL